MCCCVYSIWISLQYTLPCGFTTISTYFFSYKYLSDLSQWTRHFILDLYIYMLEGDGILKHLVDLFAFTCNIWEHTPNIYLSAAQLVTSWNIIVMLAIVLFRLYKYLHLILSMYCTWWLIISEKLLVGLDVYFFLTCCFFGRRKERPWGRRQGLLGSLGSPVIFLSTFPLLISPFTMLTR